MTNDEFTATMLMLGRKYLSDVRAWILCDGFGFIWVDTGVVAVVESSDIAELLGCEQHKKYTYKEMIEFVTNYLEKNHD